MTKKQVTNICGTVMMAIGITMANMSVVMAVPASENRENVDNITEQLSSNANLKGIYGIELNEPFDKDRTKYTASVPFETKNLYSVYTVEEDELSSTNESELDKALNVGENLVRITVTAQDGTKKVYQITVTRNATEHPSSNANLTGIYGGHLNEPFDKDRTEYTANVPFETLSLKSLYADAQDEYATVDESGRYTPLNVGETIVSIKVTAQDGTEKVYQITVTREAQVILSSNANLAAINGITLNEPFDKDTVVYTATVDRDVKFVEITAQAESESSSVFYKRYNRLNLGDNIIDIQVVADDGTQKQYVIKVNRGNTSSDANIKEISGVKLDLTYTNDIDSYRSTVPYEVSSLNIVVTAENPDSKVQIKGDVNALQVGRNFIDIIVTASNGREKMVTIEVERQDQGNHTSDETEIPIITGALVLDQEIQRNVLEYTGTLNADQSGTELFYVNVGPYSDVRVSGITAGGKSFSTKAKFIKDMGAFLVDASDMERGENILYITVRSPDRVSDTYTITVRK